MPWNRSYLKASLQPYDKMNYTDDWPVKYLSVAATIVQCKLHSVYLVQLLQGALHYDS